MSDFETFRTQDARLTMLKELATQTDYSLNDTLLARVLDLYGHRRSRDWVKTQLRALKDLGAVGLTEAGSVMIATITQAGLDHVHRRGVIEGVARPSPEA